MADTYWLVAYVFSGTPGKGAGTGRAFSTMYREGIPRSKDLISWEKQIMENDPSLGKVGITNFQQIEAIEEAE